MTHNQTHILETNHTFIDPRVKPALNTLKLLYTKTYCLKKLKKNLSICTSTLALSTNCTFIQNSSIFTISATASALKATLFCKIVYTYYNLYLKLTSGTQKL